MANGFGIAVTVRGRDHRVGYGCALIIRRRRFAELGRRVQGRVWGAFAVRMAPDWMLVAVGVGMIGVAFLALGMLPTVRHV